MADSTPQIIFGGATIRRGTFEGVEKIFSVLQKHNIRAIDSAHIFPDGEAILGHHKAHERFDIHTKTQTVVSAGDSKEVILDSMEKSLRDLGTNSVDLYYLSCPDVQVPIEEVLAAIQEIYAAGKFKRKIYDIQKTSNSVLPTVFQGNYNAMSRHIELDLFPVLRTLDISFYAYSPIAGGFFLQDPAELRAGEGQSRYGSKIGPGKMYRTLYIKDSLLKALDVWAEIARDAGISKAALGYRWIAHHSFLKREHGDALIIGARAESYLDENCAAVEEGPLDPLTAKRVDDIWETVKHEAPRDNWNSYLAFTPLF